MRKKYFYRKTFAIQAITTLFILYFISTLGFSSSTERRLTGFQTPLSKTHIDESMMDISAETPKNQIGRVPEEEIEMKESEITKNNANLKETIKETKTEKENDPLLGLILTILGLLGIGGITVDKALKKPTEVLPEKNNLFTENKKHSKLPKPIESETTKNHNFLKVDNNDNTSKKNFYGLSDTNETNQVINENPELAKGINEKSTVGLMAPEKGNTLNANDKSTTDDFVTNDDFAIGKELDLDEHVLNGASEVHSGNSNILRIGSKGPAVGRLQRNLAGLGYMKNSEIDNDFGPRTKRAVENFQRDNNIRVDGLAGPETLGTLRANILNLQVDLTAIGYRVGDLDGIFGPATKSAVERFQQRRGIQVDGQVGPITRRELRRAYHEYEEMKKLSIDNFPRQRPVYTPNNNLSEINSRELFRLTPNQVDGLLEALSMGTEKATIYLSGLSALQIPILIGGTMVAAKYIAAAAVIAFVAYIGIGIFSLWNAQSSSSTIVFEKVDEFPYVSVRRLN